MKHDKNIDFLKAVCAFCSKDLSLSLDSDSIRNIENKVFSARNVDGPNAFFINDLEGKNHFVLIISNESFPLFVQGAAQAARHAKIRLDEELGDNVCSPITSGEIDGRTFALFRKHYSFTEKRFLKYIQYFWSIGSIINWQAEIFHKTKKKLTDSNLIEKHAIEKISTIRHDDSLSRATREIALEFEKKIQNENIEVFTCFQHGDFWYGNILFAGNSSAFYSIMRNDFRVIDWPGYIDEGYPAIDVLRLSVSMFDRLGVVHWPIEKYRKKTGLSKISFGLHCICALGFLAQNLDNFEKSRFNELTENMVRILLDYGYTASGSQEISDR